jgi:thymidylate synthase
MYGYQWVNWDKYDPSTANGTIHHSHINQIQNVIELIQTNPGSRRMVVSAWNPAVLDEVALPSCHAFFIFNVTNKKLNCHLTQRSGDIALGIPFNLSCYAALTQMIAKETGLELGEFSHYINDAHIYENHIDGLKKQLTREPFPLPSLEIADKPFWDIKFEDFTLKNYQHHPVIKFPVAV